MSSLPLDIHRGNGQHDLRSIGFCLSVAIGGSLYQNVKVESLLAHIEGKEIRESILLDVGSSSSYNLSQSVADAYTLTPPKNPASVAKSPPEWLPLTPHPSVYNHDYTWAIATVLKPKKKQADPDEAILRGTNASLYSRLLEVLAWKPEACPSASPPQTDQGDDSYCPHTWGYDEGDGVIEAGSQLEWSAHCVMPIKRRKKG